MSARSTSSFRHSQETRVARARDAALRLAAADAFELDLNASTAIEAHRAEVSPCTPSQDTEN